MPSFTFSKRDFDSLLGKKLSKTQLEEAMQFAKGELDGIEGDEVKVEVSDSNRPDLWCVEGVARTLKPHFSKSRGIPKVPMKQSGLTVKIEPSVKKVRPLTACAVARNINVDEPLLVSLIQLQEKVAGTFGRKRREAAIGVYDFDKVHGDIRYFGADPRKTKFVPLEFEREMDLDEILELHPKGREYAHLLAGQKAYPLFADSEGHVLSMPPVINSNYSGKVEPGRRNLFVEVSGFDQKIIGTALNVMVMALSDRGAKIETVRVSDGKKSWVTPDFTPQKITLKGDDVRRLAGLDFSDKRICELLEKQGWNAKHASGKISAEYPAYRQDVLHWVDAAEDVLVAYGYNNIAPEPVTVPTRGSLLPATRMRSRAAQACVGLGLQEVLTMTTTSIERQRDFMGLKDDLAEIANFQSNSHRVFRRRIAPELLAFLSKNKGAPLPQRVFEAGRTVVPGGRGDTKVDERETLCIALSDFSLNFNDAKSVLDALAKSLGFAYALSPSAAPHLIEGRTGEVRVQKRVAGLIGEVHPRVLSAFGLESPVALIEVDLALLEPSK